jgi:hypothetical protein
MGLVAGASFLAGTVLGLRFKLLVLLPAMLVAVLVAGAAAIGGNAGLWPLALMAIITVVSLQVGYLVGAVASCVFDIEDNEREDLAPRSDDALQRPVRLRP